MIRWWDYIIILFYADMMTWFLLVGIFATTWYTPLIVGVIVGLLWRGWCDFYCQWRLDYEESQR